MNQNRKKKYQIYYRNQKKKGKLYEAISGLKLGKLRQDIESKKVTSITLLASLEKKNKSSKFRRNQFEESKKEDSRKNYKSSARGESCIRGKYRVQ